MQNYLIKPALTDIFVQEVYCKQSRFEMLTAAVDFESVSCAAFPTRRLNRY